MSLAIVGTQVLAVRICGFGWFVPAIPWTIFGMVWLYMLAWMIALDLIRLALYSRLRMSAARPHWYTRFLRGRNPAQVLARPGRAGAWGLLTPV